MKILSKFGPSEWLCVAAITVAIALSGIDYLPASQASINAVLKLAARQEEALDEADCFLGKHPNPSIKELRDLRRGVAAKLQATDWRRGAKAPLEVEQQRVQAIPLSEIGAGDLVRWMMFLVADHLAIVVATVAVLAAIFFDRRRGCKRR